MEVVVLLFNVSMSNDTPLVRKLTVPVHIVGRLTVKITLSP